MLIILCFNSLVIKLCSESFYSFHTNQLYNVYSFHSITIMKHLDTERAVPRACVSLYSLTKVISIATLYVLYIFVCVRCTHPTIGRVVMILKFNLKSAIEVCTV